ncbi:MAG TPA: hypothetical protein VGO64_06085, partial [Candidatus Limnocylindrales bacterium]|nr:hypothetical protein [Candidatus Limnocylindrales bacterium]
MTDDPSEAGSEEANWRTADPPAAPAVGPADSQAPSAWTDDATPAVPGPAPQGAIDAATPPATAAPVAPRYWELPAEPSAPASFGPPDDPLPGAIEIVGRGIDLNVALSGEVRRASIYVGLLYLLVFAPFLAIVAAASVQSQGFDWILEGITTGGGGFLPTLGIPGSSTFLFAALCAGAISLDTQLIALALTG